MTIKKTIRKIAKIYKNQKTKSSIVLALEDKSNFQGDTIQKVADKFLSIINKRYKYQNDFNFSPTKKIEGEINFVSSTGLDPMGKVFYKDGKVYRGIYKDKVELCKDLFNSGLLSELMAREFIPKTEISEYFSEEFPLILEHEYISGIEPCFWSFSMLRDAAIHILLIEEICKKYGYNLLDSHPWNVFIWKNKPIFIDFGSFGKSSNQNIFASEFIRTVVYPLIMWSLEDSFWAQKFLYNPTSFYKRTLPHILPDETLPVLTYIEKFKNNRTDQANEIVEKVLVDKNLRPEYICEMFADYQIETDWNDYQSWLFANIEESKEHIQKQRFLRIVELINHYSLDAKTFTDLAGNAAGFSYLLSKSKSFNRLWSIDYDEMAVEKGYNSLNKLNSNIGVFLANFMLPQKENIYELTKSDVVLAAAITHHLLLTQKFNIDFIFSQIAKYSNKYVYIEFMPLGLWSLHYPDFIPKIPDWYSEDWFEAEFKKHFELLHKEQLEKNRIIFIGKLR